MRHFAHLHVLFAAAAVVAVRQAAAASPITTLTATTAAGVLHVEATATDPAVWSSTQLMIDADGDAKTGYAGVSADRGYDFMVEGDLLYRFKGTDPAAWAWDPIGKATRSVAGGKLTLDVDRGLLNGTASARVLLRALKNFQVIATAPVATVDLTGGTATTRPAVAFSASAAQDGADLVVKVTAAKPADLDTVLLFFDTDANAATGFDPPADPRFGFEVMLQGETLSRHAGADRGGWSWLTLGTAKREVAGNTATLRFNAALLKGTAVRMAAWQMSPDWQLRTGFYPQTAAGEADTLAVNLDSSKLHADATVIDVPPAPAHADAALPPRERFKRAKTYTCYYGPDRVDALSHVDAAILHTPAQTAETVGRLNKLGVVTIGYVSIGEDDALRAGDGRGPGGKASWYFDRKRVGRPERNGVWGSYFANASDPAWRADRVAEAKRLCGTIGFDGIFLDTVDTVEPYPEARPGMIQLIGELRAALPGKVIVMNRGFAVLREPAVAGSIDGVMFEDFSDGYDFAAKQYVRFGPSDLDYTRGVMLDTVAPVAKQYGLKVLGLDYTEPTQHDRIQAAADRAVTFGMVPGVAPIALDAVYDTWDLNPHADPKYLAVMSSPAALQVTMDAARDGFPAGTVVRPSSCYMGYSVASVVDGVHDRDALDWSKRAWASAEQPDAPQQLSFLLPTPVSGGTLAVTFAVDGGQPHPSRSFDVAVRADDGSAWQTVAAPRGQTQPVFRCPLPAGPIRQIRITQNPGGGSEGRPDLMWVAQVERT